MENLQQEQPNNKLKINNVLAAVIALLLITNIVSAYFLFAGKKADIGFVNKKEQKTADKTIDKSDGNQASSSNPSTDNNAGDAIEQEYTDAEVAAKNGQAENKNLAADEIVIEWNELPVIVTSYWQFDSDALQDKIKAYNKKNDENNNADEYLKKFNIYKSGRVKQGVYAGKDLYILTFTPEGPAYRDTLFRIIQNDNMELILLAKYSDEPYGVDTEIFTVNDKITIANLDTPAEMGLSPINSPRRLKKRPSGRKLCTFLQWKNDLFRAKIRV